jgi:hypothetical protein
MAYTWAEVAVPTSAGADLRDFVWDSGHAVLVAVGGSGLVYTTPDAATWTQQTASAANSWRGVAYAPTLAASGRLCAVASSGTDRVMTSDDGGVTWTARTAAAANSWQTVKWVPWLNSGSGWFVALSSTGAADGSTSGMTSPDGITWTIRATINPRQAWCGLADNGSVLVAVSSTSATVATGGVVMTSTTATAWTQRATPANTNGVSGASSGSSVVVWASASALFAFSSKDDTGTADRHVTTSPDGTTWTQRVLPDPTDANGGILGVPTSGLVQFRQGSGTDQVNVSLDAVTWTTEDTGFNRSFDCAGQIDSLGVVVAWCQTSNTVMLVGTAPVIVPVVTSVTPATGSVNGGQAVTIRGLGFANATGVTIGGVAVASFVIVNDTTITAVTGLHASGVVDVAVLGVAVGTALYTYVIPRPLLPPLPSRTPIFQGRSRG